MALYWPEARVALEIVDDPASKPYKGPDDWTVLHVTCADIYDVHRFQKIGRELGRLLGEDASFMDDLATKERRASCPAHGRNSTFRRLSLTSDTPSHAHKTAGQQIAGRH